MYSYKSHIHVQALLYNYRRHKIVRHSQGGQSTDTCKGESSDCHTRNLKFCDTCRACLMILPDPKNCQISCTLLTFIPHELRFYL